MSRTRLLSLVVLAIAAAASAGPAAARTCISGFHLDANGRCQANNPLPPRHVCPPGHFAQSAQGRRRGYRCRPIDRHTATPVAPQTPAGTPRTSG